MPPEQVAPMQLEQPEIAVKSNENGGIGSKEGIIMAHHHEESKSSEQKEPAPVHLPLIEKLSQEDRLRIEEFLKNQQIMRTQSYGFSIVKKISKENLPVRVPRSLESEG